MPLSTNRTTFTFNHADQVDEYGASVGNFDTVQTNFDSRAEQNLTDINNIKNTLTSETVDDSGAHNIKAAGIAGILSGAAATVYAMLSALKGYVDTTAANFQLGALVDGSVTDDKLSNTAGQIKDRFTTHEADKVHKINVERYDTIADAIAAAVALKTANLIPILYFPYSEGHETASTITIPAGISVEMDGALVYTGVADEPALVIGSAADYNFDINLKLNVKRQTQSTWLSESNIGIQIINAYSSKISIVQARGFTIGGQLMGNSKGCTYNNVHLYSLLNNKYGIDCANASAGWCNENVFIGGRFGVLNGVNDTIARYGIRIKSGTTMYNDNNLFIKPSFELNAASAEAVPILIEHGNYNEFISIRNEGNGTPTIRTLNNSLLNVLDVGYGSATVEDNGAYPTTKYISRAEKLNQCDLKAVYTSPALHKLACYYDGATNVNVPTMHTQASTTGAYSNRTTLLTINADYLEIGSGRAIGRFFDTSLNKRFVIKKNCVASYEGVIQINCFDSSGTRLTSGGANHPYVKTKSNQAATYTTDWGGGYGTGAKTASDFYFVVGTDVAYIQILFKATAASALRIKSFSVYTLDNASSHSWAGYEEIIPGINLGSTTPTAGTWEANRRIINGTQAVGQPKGWSNTLSGTQGTLNSGATTGSITTGTTALVVNDATGLVVGNYITIAGVTGVKKITAISGTNITIDSNANATVSGAAVAYSNCNFVSEGNL
jgi:hypothetical protein